MCDVFVNYAMKRKVVGYAGVIQAVNRTNNFHVQITKRSNEKTFSLKDGDKDANAEKDMIVDMNLN